MTVKRGISSLFALILGELIKAIQQIDVLACQNIRAGRYAAAHCTIAAAATAIAGHCLIAAKQSRVRTAWTTRRCSAAVVVALYTSKTLGSFKKLVGPGPVSRQHCTGTLFF